MAVRIPLSALALAPLALLAATPAAATTILNFDDLGDSGVVPDGYGGITWNDNFVYYSDEQDPYNPSSPPTRIYGNYAKFSTDGPSSMAFDLGPNLAFDGFFLAGRDNAGLVSFDLYKAGNLVASSASVLATSIPTFLASNYAGAVDEVRINAVNGYWIGDDFTFSDAVAAVPEPATWAMLILGFGMAGGAMRYRRRSTRVVFG